MKPTEQPPKAFDTRWAFRFSVAFRVGRVAREDRPVAGLMPEGVSAAAKWRYRLAGGVLVALVALYVYRDHALTSYEKSWAGMLTRCTADRMQSEDEALSRKLAATPYGTTISIEGTCREAMARRDKERPWVWWLPSF